jgi:hypothetical protein
MLTPEYSVFVPASEMRPAQQQAYVQEAKRAGFAPFVDALGVSIEELSEEQADTIRDGLRAIGIFAQINIFYHHSEAAQAKKGAHPWEQPPALPGQTKRSTPGSAVRS